MLKFSLLIFFLFLPTFAFAGFGKIRGTVVADRKCAYLVTQPTKGDKEYYILEGTNEAAKKIVLSLKNDHAYEITGLIHPGKLINGAAVEAAREIKFVFENNPVEEPTIGDPYSTPPLNVFDPLLPQRAEVYRYFLQSKKWIANFLLRGGDPRRIRELRKIVLAHTLFTLHPELRQAQVDAVRDEILDSAAELWNFGNDRTLRKIQGLFEESLDSFEPFDQVFPEMTRPKAKSSCEELLSEVYDLKNDAHNLAYRMYDDLMRALEQTAVRIHAKN